MSVYSMPMDSNLESDLSTSQIQVFFGKEKE